MGPNPYSPIRHGDDGLLPTGAQAWITAVGRLAREPDLRADLISAARERLVADYDPRKRAAEWACAFRTALAGA
jgi:glycosyltransferase involved in cell wall biosynthesis